MRTWGRRPDEVPAPTVIERIRPVEVPILTDVKRKVALGDVRGALLDSYPQVVADLGRAYDVEILPGYSHEDIVGPALPQAARPLAVFLDRLFALYAPVRFAGRAPPPVGKEIIELVQSLYSSEPMWRLYIREANPNDDRATPTGPAVAAWPSGTEGMRP
ncbi:MAG: hypothetical protein L3K03_06275 [Thermoplasmata archaeon]|nr:hypothetical protein [Thermoplasmata archaeon]